MVTFLLLLGLGLVLVEPSESIMKGIRGKNLQEEMQPEVKQTVGESINSTLSDKKISLSVTKDVMSASPQTYKRFYFVILKGNTVSNGKNCQNGLIVWREVLDVNKSCQLGKDFIHGPAGVIHGVPEATSWKYGQTPRLSRCESLGLERTMCKITAGQQCPISQEHSVISLKRILTVLTSHSLMSWLVSGSKL